MVWREGRRWGYGGGRVYYGNREHHALQLPKHACRVIAVDGSLETLNTTLQTLVNT